MGPPAPQARSAGGGPCGPYGPYPPSSFARWRRGGRASLAACGEVYSQGVSTRDVQDVLREMCGLDVSSMTVSRAAAKLGGGAGRRSWAAELGGEMAEFTGRRLDHTAREHLAPDARYEKARIDGRVASRAAPTTAGFTAAGRREAPDSRACGSESAEARGEAFRSLKGRGLRDPEAIVGDARRGTRAALGRHSRGVTRQRCRAHYKREVGRKVSHQGLEELSRDPAAVFAGDGKTECRRRDEETATGWEKQSPAAGAMLRGGLGDRPAVEQLPEHHRRRLRSTNLLGNRTKRPKKRTRGVGVFPSRFVLLSRASRRRLSGAQLLELHEPWRTEADACSNTESIGPRDVAA